MGRHGLAGGKATNAYTGAVAISLLLSACGQGATATAGESDVSFDFSADPAEVILRITYLGGMTGINPAYSLFGDGRLEFRKEDIRGNVVETYDISLDYHQMHEMISIAVASNLVDTSTEDVASSLKALTARGVAPTVEDGADADFEISLTSYSRAGRELGPINNRISMHSPAYLSRFYKTRELRGYSSIIELIRKYRHGRDVGYPHPPHRSRRAVFPHRAPRLPSLRTRHP